MIAIPVLTLVPGVVGGSETYVRELLRALGRVGVHDYRAVVPPLAPDAADGLPAVVATEYGTARTIPRRLAAMTIAAARPGPLRRHVDEASVVHYPLTIELPPTDLPKVVTLHDVQHLDLPGMFPRLERAFRAGFWHRALRRADRIVAISAFVRDSVVEKLQVDPAKVRVIPQGLDHDRLRPPHEGEREPFLLYPARGWPHKNHARLFDAFSLLRRERPELRLVLTGDAFRDLPDGVDSRGRVSPDELTSLFQRASALVFPSLYEGFGLPPLEAMACGCPVACSNAAALPETVGDAARLFDPRDPQAIADAVRDVLHSPETWAERGVRRAEGFSWEATALATDAVYAELLP